MLGETYMKPVIFIGSSKEKMSVADAIEVNLSDFSDVICWKNAFSPGQNFLSDLISAADRCDFAVLVLSPDDFTTSRDQTHSSPRDNVVFEMGLFIGRLGSDRVFAIVDETTKSKIPSDYFGISILQYNGARPLGELVHAVSPACTRIKSTVIEKGKKKLP